MWRATGNAAAPVAIKEVLLNKWTHEYHPVVCSWKVVSHFAFPECGVATAFIRYSFTPVWPVPKAAKRTEQGGAAFDCLWDEATLFGALEGLRALKDHPEPPLLPLVFVKPSRSLPATENCATAQIRCWSHQPLKTE